jgi:D-sedoheptulose 7-phosphate isomerase
MNEMLTNEKTIVKALEAMTISLKNHGVLYFCGNGGSAADAQHWAAEFVGKFRISGQPIAAISLTTNTSILTAIANDFSYDFVFSRQIEATGQQGDILCVISTSGNSKSILKAAESAKRMGIHVIAFTGESPNALDQIADICIKVPSNETEVIQHVHITIGHYLAGQLEEIFRQNNPL